MRSQIAAEKLRMPFPKDGLVYDYVLDDGGLFMSQDEDAKEEEMEK